jgi:hypothetical protein
VTLVERDEEEEEEGENGVCILGMVGVSVDVSIGLGGAAKGVDGGGVTPKGDGESTSFCCFSFVKDDWTGLGGIGNGDDGTVTAFVVSSFLFWLDEIGAFVFANCSVVLAGNSGVVDELDVEFSGFVALAAVTESVGVLMLLTLLSNFLDKDAKEAYENSEPVSDLADEEDGWIDVALVLLVVAVGKEDANVFAVLKGVVLVVWLLFWSIWFFVVWIGMVGGKSVPDVLAELEEKGFAIVLVELILNGLGAVDGNGVVVDLCMDGNGVVVVLGKNEVAAVILALLLDIGCFVLGKKAVDASDAFDSFFFSDASVWGSAKPDDDDDDDENGDVLDLAGTVKLTCGINDMEDECLTEMVASLGTPNDDDDENDEIDVGGIVVSVVALAETPISCFLLFFVTFMLAVVILVLFAELLLDKDAYKELVVLFLLLLLLDVVLIGIGLSFDGVEKYGAPFLAPLVERTDDFIFPIAVTLVLKVLLVDVIEDKDAKDSYKDDVCFDKESDTLVVKFFDGNGDFENKLDEDFSWSSIPLLLLSLSLEDDEVWRWNLFDFVLAIPHGWNSDSDKDNEPQVCWFWKATTWKLFL